MGFFSSIFKAVRRILPIAAVAAPFLLPAVAPGLAAGLGATGGIGSMLGTASKIATVANAFGGLGGSSSSSSNTPRPIGAASSTTPRPQPLTRPGAMQRPNSLSGLASFDPIQERSSLATQGTQGGLGKEENDYYQNLVSRSLIGEGNKLQPSVNSLLPVEQQYLGSQGKNLGGVEELLRSIRGY